MSRSSRARAALCAPVLGLALLAPALPATPAASAAEPASLKVSPGTYVGGQQVTLHGNIGLTGVRTVKLQGSMGRPGDTWRRHARTQTDADGNFSFTIPAPSMFGIQRRVVTAGASTPVLELQARSQDLVMWADGSPVAGRPFDIRVDTVPGPNAPKGSPSFLKGRPDLPPPVFPGRQLTLQRRDGSGWSTLGTTTVDSQGQGAFENVVADAAGQALYRVRQEDYTVGGNEIGWFPSFPTEVHVSRPGAKAAAAPVARASQPADRTSQRSVTDDSSAPTAARSGLPATTSGQTRGWAPAIWDFGWEHGESLTSPPQRGTDLHGWWADGSTGLGRAAKHNGGLMLDSKRVNGNGAGDQGTTWVTLQDNPAKYGRWEARLRLRSHENNARDYRAQIELVPDRARDYCRGAQNIMIADVAAHSGKMRFGVKAAKAKRKWARTYRVGNIENVALALAVEVSKRHISWFVNGRLIGTVRSRAAVSDVPMTMRLTLRGQGDREMNRTKAIFDWMRGFTLKKGKLSMRGKRLKGSRLRARC